MIPQLKRKRAAVRKTGFDVASVRVGAVAAALALGVAAAPAVAQERQPDVDNLEVTMRLLPEGATRPEAVTRVIELPEALRSRFADGSSDGVSDTDGAGADAADPGGLPGGAVSPREDRVRTDFGEVARTAIERARELGRGPRDAAAGRGAADPAPDVPAGRDAVAATSAVAGTRDAARDARDTAAGSRDAADNARDSAADARDAAGARGAGEDIAASARDRARGAAADARDIERDVAERAREAREEAFRGRLDRPARGEPDRGRADGPERPEPGRRPDRNRAP